MDVELHGLPVRAMRPAALAGVAVAPQDVLPHVVMAELFALLVVPALWQGPAILHRPDALEVELRIFDNDGRDGQDVCHEADALDVVPDFDLDRRGKPPLVLGMHAVVKTRLAITQTVTPTAAELAAVGHQPDDIVPWPQFCGKQLLLCRRS